MQVEIRSWLFDVLTALTEIETFLSDGTPNFAQYQLDLRTKRAVERNLEIIGEAVNRIITKAPDIQITNSRRIVDTRNRIIHGYDSISDEMVWAIVTEYLPILRREIETLIS